MDLHNTRLTIKRLSTTALRRRVGSGMAALAASALLLGCATCEAQARTRAPAASDTAALFHRFTLPAKLAWGVVSLDMSAGAWRVGHIDGPAASEAQLRAVLSRVANLEIGGRCAGWVEGPTSYPCGFAVGGLTFAASPSEGFNGIAIGWEKSPGPERRLPGSDSLEFHASGLIAPVLDAPRLVMVRAAQRLLGDTGNAFGGKLTFRIRAVSNPLVPSKFDGNSGVVVLRGGPVD